MKSLHAAVWPLLAGLAAVTALAAQPVANNVRADDPLAPPPPDLASGARLYQAHCAGCHENPTGRTPGRSMIENNTRSYIVSVLAEGVMKPMAEGLSWSDIGSVAGYLAKQSGVATRAERRCADFKSDVTACAYTAAIGLSGSTSVESPSTVNVIGWAGDPNGLFIQTFDTSGTPADRGHHIIINC